MDDGRSELLDAGWRLQPAGFSQLLGMVRRQFVLAFLIVTAAVLAGVAYIVFSDPLYTASSSIYAELEPTQTDSNSLVQLDTHVELIRSDRATSAVIEELGLDEIFSANPGGLRSAVSELRQWLSREAPWVGIPDERGELIRMVREGLEVERVGNTAIIDIGYTSPSRSLSVDIAHAFASNYLREVTQRQEQTAARRVRLLQERADEVRRRATAANESAWNLRFQNNFTVADAEDLGQQITDLRTRLSAANSEEAALRARLALVADAVDMTTLHTGVLATPEAVQMFSAFVAATDRLAGVRERPGVSEATIAQLERPVADLRATLEREVRRTRDGLELELAVVTAQRSSVLAELNELARYAGSTAWSELLKAENEARLYEQMYQGYLNDLESAYRQTSATSVRLVSEALPPLYPSSPNYKVALAMAGTIGLFAAAGVALYREWTRNAGPKRHI